MEENKRPAVRFHDSTSGDQAANAPSTSGRDAELQRVWQRFSCAVVRGAVAGATIRGGLHLLGALLTRLSSRKRRSLPAGAALEDALRYTAFLASLAGIYVTADEGIKAALGEERCAVVCKET